MRGLIFIIWVLCALWVYSDAKKRKCGHEVLYALLTFFFGVFALVPYVVVTRLTE